LILLTWFAQFPFDQPASALELVTKWLKKIQKLDHEKQEKSRSHDGAFQVQSTEHVLHFGKNG